MRTLVFYSISIMAAIVFSAGGLLASPAATVVKTQFDAGTVEQGKVISHAFTFRNTGNEPLTLKVDDCGCGGLTFKTPSKAIKPGQSGTVTVNIPTSYRKGDFKRAVRIATNDPNRAEVIVSIAGSVQEVLSVTPQYIHFGQVKPGVTPQQEITLTNSGKTVITIASIKVEPAAFAHLAPAVEHVHLKPGDKQTIVLSLKPIKASGTIEGEVIIKTTMKSIAEKIIPVLVEPKSE
jgi:hypothetical protein